MLKLRLQEEMKQAMKAKDSGRLSVIRSVRSAIQNEEIEKGRELEDPEVIEVIAREMKQRQEALPEYARGGREDLVKKMQDEIEVLKTYLPEQLPEADVRALILETVQSIGATSPKDMGKVMSALMPKVKGRADGKLVNQIVKELLQG